MAGRYLMSLLMDKVPWPFTEHNLHCRQDRKLAHIMAFTQAPTNPDYNLALQDIKTINDKENNRGAIKGRAQLSIK